MKIALYKIADMDLTMIREASTEPYATGVRISEYVEVDFPPRDAAEVEALLNKSKRERAEKLRRELDKISNELAKVENTI